MQENMRRCPRCTGAKKMYKGLGNNYSLCNFGGKLENCPFCDGSGQVKKIEDVQEDVTKVRKYKKEIIDEPKG